METWKRYPPIPFDAPVLGLAAGQDWLWAAGAGGVARIAVGHADRLTGDGWVSCSVGLPLESVTALAFCDGWLLAGGADGLARSKDGGQNWESGLVSGAAHPVMCLVASPAFGKDFTVIAGTLGGGILRSIDAGRTWKSANFGMQNEEVLSLAWDGSGMLLAGTNDGIYRSNNGGRAWRSADGSEGLPVSGLVFQPDGSVLASIESGGLLVSNDSGASWSDFVCQLPEDALVSGLFVLPGSGIVACLPDLGTFRSMDGGHTWQQIIEQAGMCLCSGPEGVFLGLADRPQCGVVALRGDLMEPLPQPPLHDLRTLTIVDQAPVVAGLHSGAFIWRKETWRSLLTDTPTGVITALAQAGDGGLVLSSAQGLLRSTDGGENWKTVLAGEAGLVARLTFRSDGLGWAACGDGARLLHTLDHGQHWEAQPAPFGVLPLAALQATAQALIAATYDPHLQSAQIWYSEDEGQHWKRGVEAHTPWPVVAAAGDPALLSLGGIIYVLHPNGRWVEHSIQPGAGIRRVTGRGPLILALTTHGLFRSTDLGNNWLLEPGAPPAEEILDLAVDQDILYLLLTGGRVLSRPLGKQ